MQTVSATDRRLLQPQFRRILRNDGCNLINPEPVTQTEAPIASPIATLRALHPGALPAEIALTGPGLVIGRDARCAAVVVRREGVSRRHCWIGRHQAGPWTIRDLDSRNGVFVNGQRIEGEHALAAGDVVGLGRSRLADFELNINGLERQVVLSGTGPWRIGRDLACELSLPADPGVSQQHAIMRQQDGQLLLEDSGSRNGTWLNGRRIRRARLQPGDSIILAGSRVRLETTKPEPRLAVSTIEQALSVQVQALSTGSAPGQGLSFEILPARLQALVVADTEQRLALLDVLAGMRTPSGGALAWSEPELNQARARLRTRVGRVGRREVPVCAVPVEAWLEQQASLAAAGDVSEKSRRERVATILAELNANHLNALNLDRLTALEQALVQLASELLTNPGLLLVDVPAALESASDRAELLDRLQALAGPRLSIVLALDQPLDIVPGAAHIDIHIGAPGPMARERDRALRPRGFSAAASRALLRDQLRGWRRQPLMLFETLALPVLLVAGLWLALPDHSDSWILLVSLGLAAALGAAFQVSRQPGRLLRTARRHLLLDDALLAVFTAACLVAAVQTGLGLTVFLLLPDSSLTPGLFLAAILSALSGTALGLVCGAIAGHRSELALLLVASLGAGMVVADSLAEKGLALASPLPWSQAVADMATAPHAAALGAAIMAIQLTGLVLVARYLLQRRL
ncbi:MAG: FHA domain-containing protein [Wenzhouxiangella sp.]|nr:MAG: FHA domain-containing protein [Wenzhouxiangella sp.]